VCVKRLGSGRRGDLVSAFRQNDIFLRIMHVVGATERKESSRSRDALASTRGRVRSPEPADTSKAIRRGVAGIARARIRG
jgi:hypothetical protein